MTGVAALQRRKDELLLLAEEKLISGFTRTRGALLVGASAARSPGWMFTDAYLCLCSGDAQVWEQAARNNCIITRTIYAAMCGWVWPLSGGEDVHSVLAALYYIQHSHFIRAQWRPHEVLPRGRRFCSYRGGHPPYLVICYTDRLNFLETLAPYYEARAASIADSFGSWASSDTIPLPFLAKTILDSAQASN